MTRSRGSAARVSEVAPLFAALGDETRLQIVRRLCDDGPLSIVRLTEGSNVSRQAVTKHLRALCDVGLVRSERSGREQIWELQTRRLAEVRKYLDQISEQWDSALARLRSFVEENE
jgi:DNA-binding transcriptional ArsR family regulator